MLSIRYKSIYHLLKVLLIILMVHGEEKQYSKPKCIDPEEPMKIRFIDHVLGIPLRYYHHKIGIFPSTFASITNFVKVPIDFKVNKIDENELYSVILMQQGTYPRLDPDGYVRLKWFVANIPGEDLLKGKSKWRGTVLQEFEPIVNRDKYEFNLLWIYKHVDNKTILEEPIEGRMNFVLQNYYDFLCSKPMAEIVFGKEEDEEQIQLDVQSAKRLVN